MGLSVTTSQAALDGQFPTSGSTDHVMYSANGTSETASLARTAIGATGWAAATAADPSVKANNAVLTSAGASAGVTVTHEAVISAASGGTQKTDWQPLGGGSRTLAIGDKLEHAIGALQVTLT